MNNTPDRDKKAKAGIDLNKLLVGGTKCDLEPVQHYDAALYPGDSPPIAIPFGLSFDEAVEWLQQQQTPAIDPPGVIGEYHPTDAFEINDPLFSALRVSYYETPEAQKEADDR